MWVSPARKAHRVALVRSRMPLLALLLLVLAACGPKVTNQPPATDEPGSGSLTITVKGLTGVAADITVSGPGSYSQEVGTSTTLTELPPGEYSITASTVSGYVVVGESAWTVQVEDGATASVIVEYSAADLPPVGLGSLEIIIDGLNGVAADIRVTGPEAFSWDGTQATTLEDLMPGGYTVTAAPVAEFVVVGDAVQAVSVTADAQSTVTIRYSDAALALSGSGSLTVPLHKSAQAQFTIDRRGAFTGDVSFEVQDIAGLTVTPLSGTVPAGVSTFTVTVQDDEAELGDYPLAVSVAGESEGRPLTDSTTVAVSLVAVVTDGGDDDDDPIPGSLRALLEDERTEGEAITFHASLYESGPLEISLADTLAITSSVNIDGPDWQGAATGPLVVLDGRSASRVLAVTDATVSVTNLQLQNGVEQHGAGVLVTQGATFTLVNSYLRDNKATLGSQDQRRGGAIWAGEGSTVELRGSHVVNNTADWRGGGIYVAAGLAANPTRLIVSDSVVSGNHAQNGGGIFVDHSGFAFDRAHLQINSSSMISNNTASHGGGGIFSYGEAVIEDSTIQGNKADGSGGGIRNHLRMSISDSDISGNIAAGDYGGLFSDGILTLTESRVTGNSAGGDGGGVANGWYGNDVLHGQAKMMTISRTTLSHNRAAGAGGGIYSIRRLQIADSYVYDNEAEGGHGGGIYSVSIPHSGAPANDGGTLLISGTTIAENHAPLGNGGGVYSGTLACANVPPVSGCLDPFQQVPTADLHIHNSTIVLNTAQWGGGIATSGANSGEVRLNFNTIVNNMANGAGGAGQGGGIHNSRPDFRIRGNIFAHNSASGGDLNSYDIYTWSNDIRSDGHNFLQRSPDADAQLIATDISSGSLAALSMEQLPAANGGFAPTLALSAASAYGNYVPPSECLGPDGVALTVDQRGEPRPGNAGTGCSIGAYEYQGN